MRISTQVALFRVLHTTHRLLTAAVGEKRVHQILHHRVGRMSLGNMVTGWRQHLRRPAIADPIVVDGHLIYHGGQSQASEMASGLYEPKTVRLMRHLSRPGMTFVDVGAHIGFYTLLAARAVGQTGHVHAFEPERATFDLLRKNVIANGYEDSVTLVRKAVCEVSGYVSIFRNQEHSSSTMHASAAPGATPVSVAATTLDHYFRERGWPRVDLMKMDIEGSEAAALRCMRELSHRNPGLKLIVEYDPYTQGASGETPHRLFEILDELGFCRKSVISWHLISVERPEDLGSTLGTLGANLMCEKE